MGDKGEEKDCVMCKILNDGICKSEFLSFDACYDASVIEGRDDSACEKLVRKDFLLLPADPSSP